MLFDTHAGLLAPPEFEEFAARPVEAALRRVSDGVPRIYYSGGTAGVMERIGKLPVEVVGIDYRIELSRARAALGPLRAVQGNLDPAALLGPPGLVAERASEVLLANAGRPGHVFNLGHGILPETPLESVQALGSRVTARGAGRDRLRPIRSSWLSSRPRSPIRTTRAAAWTRV